MQAPGLTFFIIWGRRIDDLEDTVQITVIAIRFDGSPRRTLRREGPSQVEAEDILEVL